MLLLQQKKVHSSPQLREAWLAGLAGKGALAEGPTGALGTWRLMPSSLTAVVGA